MPRKYPTIYPVLNLNEGKVECVFNELEDARKYILKQKEESKPANADVLSVLVHETKRNLVDFSLGQLLDIYARLLPDGVRKHNFYKKSTVIAAIFRHLGQRKKRAPAKGRPVKTTKRKIETAPIRRKTKGPKPKIKSKLDASNGDKDTSNGGKKVRKRQIKKRRSRMRFKLPTRVSVTTVELESTGESYRLTEERGFSARYFFHKYITKGYDKDTVLRKVKFQTGEPQDPNYYQLYVTELRKLGVIEDGEPPTKHH